MFLSQNNQYPYVCCRIYEIYAMSHYRHVTKASCRISILRNAHDTGSNLVVQLQASLGLSNATR